MKILFLGQGSGKDPGFDDVNIGGKHYKEYMKEKGIIVLDKVVESCHGCPDIMTNYSEQMQNKIEIGGSRVVAVLQGGLLFGLPSIQATQVTYPIISTPLDMVAYTAFMVPSGHAVIAGVGVEQKDDATQRRKALMLAERMLNLDTDQVVIVRDESKGELEKELAKFDIKIRDYQTDVKALALAYGNDLEYLGPISNNSLLIRADSDEDLNDWGYLKEAEDRHHQGVYNVVPTAQVRGVKNLAIYAAKILSLQRPELREKIKKIEKDKRSTYKERNLTSEIIDIRNEMFRRE